MRNPWNIFTALASRPSRIHHANFDRPPPKRAMKQTRQHFYTCTAPLCPKQLSEYFSVLPHLPHQLKPYIHDVEYDVSKRLNRYSESPQLRCSNGIDYTSFDKGLHSQFSCQYSILCPNFGEISGFRAQTPLTGYLGRHLWLTVAEIIWHIPTLPTWYCTVPSWCRSRACIKMLPCLYHCPTPPNR